MIISNPYLNCLTKTEMSHNIYCVCSLLKVEKTLNDLLQLERVLDSLEGRAHE